jgi:hypothetical protein
LQRLKGNSPRNKIIILNAVKNLSRASRNEMTDKVGNVVRNRRISTTCELHSACGDWLTQVRDRW